MISSFLTKENLALLGVVALFLWRIIDFLIRQKKKREYDLEKLAFEMAKYHSENAEEFPKASLFAYYLFYLDALERKMRPYSHSYNIMKSFDTRLTERIAHLDQVYERLEKIEHKFADKHEISPDDLWIRNPTWGIWWAETKKRIVRTFKRRTHFHSVT